MSFDIRLDVDPVITCPYNNSHKIPRSRIQKHLVKCEKNFPADYKLQCPYDATHRIFEHEMIDHVTNCNMKFINHLPNDHYTNVILPEVDPELEFKIQSDENWDEYSEEEDEIQNNPFNEPIFENLNVKHYTNIPSTRGNSLISRCKNSKLRRPYGYSESMMLDISSQTIDDDTQSVTSDMGFGRGQSILGYSRGQNVRGAGRIYRRNCRGR